MNKTVKTILKIFAVVAAVLILLPVTVIGSVLVMNWMENLNRDCQKGPLATVTECDFDKSAASWMNSGFWTSDAKGTMEGASCDVVSQGEEKLPFTEMLGNQENDTTIYKVSCENFGHGIQGVCYAAQKMPSNGNSRYVKILIANGCGDVRYFEGSKYTIQDGKPAFYEWIRPIPHIPDEKTGKIEPVQDFVETPNKTGLSRRG